MTASEREHSLLVARQAIVFRKATVSPAKRTVCALMMAALSALTIARPDVNSFLNKPAKTTETLIQQVKTDPEVADRYTRHFAMSKAEVVAYLSYLRPSTIGNEGAYMIYSVPKDGRLKAHVELIKKGTPIFADALGKPALIMKCGNPMTKGPRNPESANENAVDTVEEERIALRDAAEDVRSDISQVIAMNNPAEPGLPTLTTTPEPIVTSGSPTRIVQGIPGGGGLNLGPLGLGMALFGAGLASINTGGTTVPEPSAMIALSAGILFVATRRKRS